MKKLLEQTLIYFITLLMVITVFSHSDYTSTKVEAASKTSTISIKKSPVLKSSNINTTSVKLSWGKTKGATSYKIYRSTNKVNWKTIATTKSTTYTVKKLTAGKKYYFKIKAYKNKTSSPYSKIITVTPKPAQVSGLTAKSKSFQKITISWKKVSGATGYKVYKYNSSKKKWEAVKTTSKTSYTAENLKINTAYKFRVRAYKKVNSKAVYGKVSKTYTASTKPIVNLIGKTLSGITSVYGKSYVKDYFEGSAMMNYKKHSIGFLLNNLQFNSNNTIKSIISYGKNAVIGKLSGKMKYAEIVKVVGSKSLVGTPSYHYDAHYGEWIYSVKFIYKGYSFYYEWDSNPQKNNSSFVIINERNKVTKVADAIKLYDAYTNYGACCDLEYEWDQEVYDHLPKKLQGLCPDLYKSTCCNTIAQAKEHIKYHMDPSVTGKISTSNFLEYNGSLYIIAGAMGHTSHSYEDISIKKLSDTKLTAIAKSLNSGDYYYGEKDKFTITKKNGTYVISKVTTYS